MEELGLFSIWSIAEKLNVSKMSGFKLSEDICGKVSQRVEDHEPNDSFLTCSPWPIQETRFTVVQCTTEA